VSLRGEQAGEHDLTVDPLSIQLGISERALRGDVQIFASTLLVKHVGRSHGCSPHVLPPPGGFEGKVCAVPGATQH
jgi:hypothetical protein